MAQRICLAVDGVVVHVALLDDLKRIDADGRAARGPMVVTHRRVGLNKPERREEGESVFVPEQCGEQFKGAIIVPDPNGDGHVGGTWTQRDGFGHPKLSPEHIQAALAGVRASCEAELAATAWTQAPDEPEEFRAKWAAYRRELRELRDNPPDPVDVKYPQRPFI